MTPRYYEIIGIHNSGREIHLGQTRVELTEEEAEKFVDEMSKDIEFTGTFRFCLTTYIPSKFDGFKAVPMEG